MLCTLLTVAYCGVCTVCGCLMWYRLLPLSRRGSFFISAFGFYVANAITMYTVHIVMSIC